MTHPYPRLAPFIQEYLYRHGWTSLREVQVEACRIIFETDAHLLVAAGTASGKTEAAFLPVLTVVHETVPKTIAALYIGPIKALINDQFDRLSALLKEADIPCWAWHADIAQSQKQRLLKQPQGILQITPESLESLLINQANNLDQLFGDLRFVIIDEIHTFIGSDRGSQLLCQLNRLARSTQNFPRRIGLSATLGDYEMAQTWLRAGTVQPVLMPQVSPSSRKIHLSLEQFEDPGLVVRAKGETRDEYFNPYYLHLFNQTKAKKCLIFANGRMETESVIAQLREIAQAKGEPDIYHVHHGSISAQLREAAEVAMRDSSAPTVTAATVTFEMGIDLGQLDRVIQLESPPSVASFLQRLGRSGRRDSPADMRFVCVEEPLTVGMELPDLIPWQLLQCIAVIQLYLEEKWIEPLAPLTQPFSLLYHQTMSTLRALGELSPPELAKQVMTLPPFRTIALADFRYLLQHLIDLDHIQKTPQGGLILGIAAERIVNNFKFYAIFPDQEEYQIYTDSLCIGAVAQQPIVGDRLALAGRVWQVLEVHPKRKTALVKPSSGNATQVWRGSRGVIHPRILTRMRQVLLEDTEYPYLQANASARLKKARDLAHARSFGQKTLFEMDDNHVCLLPWMGTIAYRTLERYLRQHCRDALKIKGVMGRSPYFLIVNLGMAHIEELQYELRTFRDHRLQAENLIGAEEVPKLQKYDEFIPPDLLRKAFAADHLDVDALADAIDRWSR